MACIAPPGAWCNATSVIPTYVNEAQQSSARSLASLHDHRALVVGGCCCHLCDASCASSSMYDCNTCAGAATAECASCYFAAMSHHNSNGDCWESPPQPPSPPPSPAPPPSVPALQSPGYPPPSPTLPPLPPHRPEVAAVHGAHFPPPPPADDPYRREMSTRLFLPTVTSLAFVLMITCSVRIFVCYLIHRHRLRHLNQRNAREPSAGAAAAAPPLDLSALTKWTISPRLAPGDDDDAPECCICLSAFSTGDVAMRLPCAHEFHEKCDLRLICPDLPPISHRSPIRSPDDLPVIPH